ncbi:uncharacterized protein LOC142317579 [Lycorma delicatula]|uniref:uncharacterized protein LOC142317579 n=1 Tax=Lycorma delicatula TaxID=130591 RepID=UPI003F51624B
MIEAVQKSKRTVAALLQANKQDWRTEFGEKEAIGIGGSVRRHVCGSGMETSVEEEKGPEQIVNPSEALGCWGSKGVSYSLERGGVGDSWEPPWDLVADVMVERAEGQAKGETLVKWQQRWSRSQHAIFENDFSPVNLFNTLKEQKLRSIFPNVSIVLCLFYTLPLIIAEAERSFSMLAKVKNFLCSTMAQDRLSSLRSLAIEPFLVRQLNSNELIDTFVKKQMENDKLLEEKEYEELRSELPTLKNVFEEVINHLKKNQCGMKDIADITALWAAVIKREDVLSRSVAKMKHQKSRIAELNSDITDLKEMELEPDIELYKQKIENSAKLLDIAFLREQIAQGKVEDLRNEIRRLNEKLQIKKQFDDKEERVAAAFAVDSVKEEAHPVLEKWFKEVDELKGKLKTPQTEMETNERKFRKDSLQINNLITEIKEVTRKLDSELQCKKTYEENFNKLKVILINQDKLIKELETEKNVLKKELEKKEILKKNIQTQELKITKTEREKCNFSTSTKVTAKKIKEITLAKKIIEKDKQSLTEKISKYEKLINQLQNEIGVQKDLNNENVKTELDNALKDLNLQQKIIKENITKFNTCEQLALEQTENLDKAEKFCAEIKRINYNLLKDKQRVLKENKELYYKLSIVISHLQTKNIENKNLMKKIKKLNLIVQHETKLADGFRAQKNSKTKKVLQAQNHVSQIKEKIGNLNKQIEDYKKELLSKNTEILRNQTGVKKLKEVNEGLTNELERRNNTERKARKEIRTLQKEVGCTKISLVVANATCHKITKNLIRAKKEKYLIGTRLVRRNDEIEFAYAKSKILECMQYKYKDECDCLLKKIQLMKVEIQNLRNERVKNIRCSESINDLRKEIYYLEKELLNEKLRCRALEQTIQTPLNVHRWRKLEGSDPTRMNLIKKVRYQQKTLMQCRESIKQKNEEIEDYKEKLSSLRQQMSHMLGPDVQKDLLKIRRELADKNKELKIQKSVENALKATVLSMKIEVEKREKESKDLKKMYLEKKIQVDKCKVDLNKYKMQVKDKMEENKTNKNINKNRILPKLQDKKKSASDVTQLKIVVPKF